MKMGQFRKRSPFPEGWFDYIAFKDVIPVPRIIPLKTPLPVFLFQSNEFLKLNKWTPADVMACIPNLGLVIDLTFKNPCYYNPIDFLDNGVDHKKISCRGHVVPDDALFNQFCEVVESFLEENATNDDVIGIHCTHGVNRTGYMICRFLVERRNYSPEKALQTFALKRGYPVERENYIEAIFNASNCN